MKTIKRIFLLAFSALIFGNVHTLNAQVTIGSELEPNAGSLLDLKQDDTSPGANSTKGFNLPRVALASLNSLSPCADDTDANKKSHTGLTVYNTTSNNDFKAGTYVWDGTSWIPTKDRAKRVDANFKNTEVTEIASSEAKNVASFVVPESGCYAVNILVRCVRSLATTGGFYHSYVTGNNYSYLFGIAYATDALPAAWGVRTYRTYVDYLEAGTYYLTLNVWNTVFTYTEGSVSLVKLSD